MKLKLIDFGAVLLLAAALSPGTPAAAQESLVAEGATVYGNTCGTCHNPRSPIERSDREWVTIVNHMRIRANLTGRQTRAVLAFLQATNGDQNAPTMVALPNLTGIDAAAVFSDEVPTDPQLVNRGADLVAEKACVGCHVIAGAGGNVGPGLDDVVARRGASFVRRKLTDPTFNNAESMMPNLGLSTADIDALVAYVAAAGRD